MSAPKVCISYLRQSQGRPGEDETNSLSLDSQAARVQSFAAREGWRIVDEIRDHDVSGERWERDGLQRLITRVKAGGVDAVVVFALNRLARRVLYQEMIIEVLKENGVELISVSEPGLQDVLMRVVHGGVAEHHQAQLRRVIKSNLETRAKRGLHHGRPPYGYVVAGTRESGKRLEQVPHEAEVVRRIYQMRADGMGVRSIGDVINGEGITSKQGTPFHDNSIRKILTTPTYAGYAVYQGTIIGDLAPGVVDPIIPRPLYHQVQRSFDGNRSPQRKAFSSWLEGLIKHACGANMGLMLVNGNARQAEKVAFRCNRFSRVQAFRCRTLPLSLHQAAMERAAMECLVTDLTSRPLDPAALVQARATVLGQPDAIKRRNALIRQKTATIEQIKRAEQLVTTGRRDLDWFDAQDQDAQSKLRAIDAELETLMALPAEDDLAARVAEIGRLIPAATLLRLSPDACRAALGALGHVVFDGTVRVVYAPEYADCFPEPTVIRPVYERVIGGSNGWRLERV